jgi:hypothetical protein
MQHSCNLQDEPERQSLLSDSTWRIRSAGRGTGKCLHSWPGTGVCEESGLTKALAEKQKLLLTEDDAQAAQQFSL